jgi:predicted O-linked N-acetylglucosamine transferase (SPINDLY family)
VDIALDSYPYCGTTTTFESVLMGVPVITRAGETHASRVGLAIMNYLGTPGFAAETDEGFITSAAALAANPAELKRLRATLRPWLLASPLCNSAGMGHRFASAVRALWRQRCTR